MTDLVPYQQPTAEIVAVRDLDSWTQVAGQVVRLAEQIADTPFVPDGLRGSIPATAAAILAGRELGLQPMTALANVHVIKGKPALSAALMRALILSQGHQIETVEISDTRAIVRGRRRGEAQWEEASFTRDQAAKARIDLGGYPQDKLYARATSRLARRKFADVIAGMPYSAEELEDGSTADEAPAAPAATEAQPRPRTARRRQSPTSAAAPAAAGSTPDHGGNAAATPANGAPPLPPLPGEDEAQERDYDSPGTVTPAQLTKLGALFTGLGFGKADREQRLVAAGEIVRREIGSASELSKNEASTLIDTLERCDGDRERLITLLATGEAPEATDGQ